MDKRSHFVKKQDLIQELESTKGLSAVQLTGYHLYNDVLQERLKSFMDLHIPIIKSGFLDIEGKCPKIALPEGEIAYLFITMIEDQPSFITFFNKPMIIDGDNKVYGIAVSLFDNYEISESNTSSRLGITLNESEEIVLLKGFIPDFSFVNNRINKISQTGEILEN